MKPLLPLIVVLGICFGGHAAAQYGYVPPTPPPEPVPPSPYPTYPASPQMTTAATPPPGAGMDMGYGYGGYGAQPPPVPPPGFAGDILSYGYLEGFYQYTDFQHEGLDGSHGIGLALSAQLFKPVFIKAGFNWSSGGGDGANSFDFNSVALGLGAYLPLADRFHLLCDVGGAYYELDADKDSLGFSDGAVYVHPALRFAATPRLEFQAGLTFSSSDDYGSFIVDVGAYWAMFRILDIKLGADIGDESTAYKAGLRVRW